ncbi:pre-mRNA-splicing factor ISY1 homolog isoform X1 [Thamnophis elegans]|uniref:pre-mRNA-splicing factor ISY1 homolog isoform X1 n=1 Tax=Thamnophis elegans TaxID=35005 RepID=UPI001377F846|nr:pre-mRNA-splicing factor ISY1 homolog isoform X1 [Thamnophis elegans]
MAAYANCNRPEVALKEYKTEGTYCCRLQVKSLPGYLGFFFLRYVSGGVSGQHRVLQRLQPWTALARFRQAQLEEGKLKERRPFLASECNELPKAEKWRRQIIGEISKKVAQIQNAGLGEFRIRDLNDEINKLLREKGHWEVRIKELGGPDYARIGPKMLDHEGKEVPGNRGYKYFGAAKDLPGVRELFEKEPLPPPRKTRAELMKAIDAEYYGYRDEDDGVLEPLEQEHEKKVIAEAVERWKVEREAHLARGDKEEEEEEENIYAVNDNESDEENGMKTDSEDSQQKFIAHVPVPSQQEIEEALVRRKKMELLQKYASEALLAQSEEAKKLLGL